MLFLSMKNQPYLAYSKGDTKENILGHPIKQRQRCRENKGGGKPIKMKAHLFSNSFYFPSKTRCFTQCFASHCFPIWQGEGSRISRSCSQTFNFLIILLLRFLLSNKRIIYHFSSSLAIFHCGACCKPHWPT